MPSSGLPMVEIGADEYLFIKNCREACAHYGLEREWWESFIGAIKAGATVYQAAQAGVTEWDC